MLVKLLQMFALIGLGLLWSLRSPRGLDAETSRRVLTAFVYYLFLPALVLVVLWQAPLGANSLRISASAAFGIIIGMIAGWLLCRSIGTRREVSGAIILASAFPNATYLGLPVLEQVLGPAGRSIAIQYDLFACMPLLLTVGIMVASRYGNVARTEPALVSMLKVPALWAALLAVGLNLAGTAPPRALSGLLEMMARPVVPLMLVAVGLALKEGLFMSRYLSSILPVIAIQLALMPLLVWWLAGALGLTGELLTGVVLEAAMPSMALGVVLSDRYGLSTGVYAAAMTATTLVSLFTLPLWFAALG